MTVSDLQNHVGNLRTQVAGLQQSIADTDKRAAQIEQEITAQLKREQEAKRNHETSVADIAALDSHLAEKQAQRSDLNEELDSLHQRLLMAQSERAARIENTAAKRELEELAMREENLNMAWQHIETLKVAESQSERLREFLSQTLADQETGESTASVETAAEYQARYAMKKEELERAKTNVESRLEAERAQAEEIENRIDSLNEQIRVVDAKLLELDDQIKALIEERERRERADKESKAILSDSAQVLAKLNDQKRKMSTFLHTISSKSIAMHAYVMSFRRH